MTVHNMSDMLYVLMIGYLASFFSNLQSLCGCIRMSKDFYPYIMSHHCIIISCDAKQEMKVLFLAGTIFRVL